MNHFIYRSAIFTFIIFSTLAVQTFAQSDQSQTPHPKFTPFQGTVYNMPALVNERGKLRSISIQEYYSDTVYTYEKIGSITLNKLDIPETYTSVGKFPGVEKKVKFAMILESKMKIFVDGCYEFKLTSDDGSRLWIDEVQIVNNDGGHKMKTKRDTMAFRKGSYDAKVWYFQGMPDRFGLLMDAKLIDKIEGCPTKLEVPKKEKRNIITLRNILFDLNTFEINEEGLAELILAADQIKKSGTTKVQIIGHTDNQGTKDYNQTLSLKRAQAIKYELEELLRDESIELIAKGFGSTTPITSNETKEGQSKNRRVELIFK